MTPIHAYSQLIGAVAPLQPRSVTEEKRRRNRSDKESEDDLARREHRDEDAHRDQDLTGAAEEADPVQAPAKIAEPAPAAEGADQSHLDIIA